MMSIAAAVAAFAMWVFGTFCFLFAGVRMGKNEKRKSDTIIQFFLLVATVIHVGAVLLLIVAMKV
jgi:hypothetical protein